ncbi:MAG: NAD(P)-binding domain-containing protein [Pseudomonadota bacterium]
MSVPYITEASVGVLEWSAVADAIAAGHRGPRAKLSDQLLSEGEDRILSRAAWIAGRGAAVKSVTVIPGNAALGRPTIHGAMLLFDAAGAVAAVIDSALVTRLKTAGDSLLGARLLARPDARRLVILGAGNVARSLTAAYRTQWPDLQIAIWNRNPARAEALAAETAATAVTDLPAAVGAADIVATATLSPTPILQGALLSPGTHVDLIGAFTPDMREADDAVLTRGRIFVDSRETTLDHIGEIRDPLTRGVIAPQDILGDFYDLCTGAPGRTAPEQITVFKNGGGAHMDLMTGRLIFEAWKKVQG